MSVLLLFLGMAALAAGVYYGPIFSDVRREAQYIWSAVLAGAGLFCLLSYFIL